MYPHIMFVTPVELRIAIPSDNRKCESFISPLLELYFFENSMEINGLRRKGVVDTLFVQGAERT